MLDQLGVAGKPRGEPTAVQKLENGFGDDERIALRRDEPRPGVEDYGV